MESHANIYTTHKESRSYTVSESKRSEQHSTSSSAPSDRRRRRMPHPLRTRRFRPLFRAGKIPAQHQRHAVRIHAMQHIAQGGAQRTDDSVSRQKASTTLLISAASEASSCTSMPFTFIENRGRRNLHVHTARSCVNTAAVNTRDAHGRLLLDIQLCGVLEQVVGAHGREHAHAARGRTQRVSQTGSHGTGRTSLHGKIWQWGTQPKRR